MNKPKVVIDFETRSPVDLENEGRMKYACHPETDILMLGWKLDKNMTQLWLPGRPRPGFIRNPENYIIYAHNAQFEHIIWNKIGTKYGYAPIKISNFIDIMALCGRYGVPQSLDKAGKVLKLQMQKDKEGKALIKLFCTPEFNFGRDSHGKILGIYVDKWLKFQKYCTMDVDSEYELLNTLPADHLSADEQWAWEHSCKVNSIGIPIDYISAARISEVTEIYSRGQFDLLPDLTNNKITKITQTKRIVDFFNEKGVQCENCQSETIAKLLERDDLPEEVEMVAEMRASIGMSSLGKYKRIAAMHYNGRIYDNQQYYGAHTGRWTGGGFQLLNLPRASVGDPEAEIGKFFDGSIMEDNPVRSARALIRPMIKATPGKAIIAADYASIEYVVLEWFAGNTEALERFKAGFDQYVDEASTMYGVLPEAVDAVQRQNGKIVVLGCGYGLGANGLIRNAEKQWGMKLTFEEADFMVKRYRKKHALVVSMWYKMKDAMLLAITQKGKMFETHKCRFKVVKDKVKTEWLALTLPSGRTMYYNSPFVDEGTYGTIPCHYGLNQETKTWRPMELIPGRIAENVVQAAARDILVNGMKALDREGFTIIGSIYDEIIAEIPFETDKYLTNIKGKKEPFKYAENLPELDKFCTLMSETAAWSANIPVRAEGYIGPRYRKM